MRSLLLLLLLSFALFAVHGRIVGNEENNVFEWSLNQIEQEQFLDEDREMIVADDNLKNEDGFFDDLSSADDISADSFETDTDDNFDIIDGSDDKRLNEYSLMGCSGGKCDICFKVWKLRGCFIVELTSDGIEIEFKAFGKSLYSHKIRTNGDFTLKVKKDRLPKWLRRLMRSDIEIKFSSVDLARKRMCVQVKARVKFVGTVRWPKHSPHCFNL